MEKSKKNSCPKNQILEAFITDALDSKDEIQTITHHLNNCHQCHQKINEIVKFNSILGNEIENPVSSTAFRLLNQIEKNRVIIAGVMLRPVVPLNGHKAMDFHSQIMISKSKGTASNLHQLECTKVEKDEVFLRVVQSPVTLETTLFVFSHHKKLYRNIQFCLDWSGKKFIGDGKGKIELGKFDINQLDKKLITISMES